MSDISPDVRLLRTEGYYAAGDGGGGAYARVAAPPQHAGRLQSADGAWWQLCGGSFSVRQFGARGDGETDDSPALQAALDCPLAAALTVPPGHYRAIGLRLMRACRLSGEAAELFWDVPGDERDLLFVDAPSVEISGLTLRGLRWEQLSDPAVSPHTLLRLDPREPQDSGEVRLRDLTFVGGVVGCFVGLLSNIFIDRVRFERCRYLGLFLCRGTRNIIINGLIASHMGEYGAVVTGFGGTLRATERLVLNDFVITDSGCY
jgi:hypothetical protein